MKERNERKKSSAHGKKQLENQIGKHVNTNLLALGLAVSSAGAIRQTGGEDLLDDLGRGLGNGLAAVVVGHAETARQVWTAVEAHGEAGERLGERHADLQQHRAVCWVGECGGTGAVGIVSFMKYGIDVFLEMNGRVSESDYECWFRSSSRSEMENHTVKTCDI